MVRRDATSFVLVLGLTLLTASTCDRELTDAGGDLADGGVSTQPPCEELVEQVCGSDGECADQGWCAAANLMAAGADSDPQCQAALDDNVSYPPCPLDPQNITSCAELIDLVCGPLVAGERPCAGDYACVNAELLAADPDGGSTDARAREARCLQAQQETALYPPCPR